MGFLVGRMLWTCAGLVNKSTVDLAVEEDKIGINGGPRDVLSQQIIRIGANVGGVNLREINNTLFITGDGGIISRSQHRMNLGGWFTFRTDARSMAELAAGPAPNIGHARFRR